MRCVASPEEIASGCDVVDRPLPISMDAARAPPRPRRHAAADAAEPARGAVRPSLGRHGQREGARAQMAARLRRTWSAKTRIGPESTPRMAASDGSGPGSALDRPPDRPPERPPDRPCIGPGSALDWPRTGLRIGHGSALGRPSPGSHPCPWIGHGSSPGPRIVPGWAPGRPRTGPESDKNRPRHRPRLTPIDPTHAMTGAAWAPDRARVDPTPTRYGSGARRVDAGSALGDAEARREPIQGQFRGRSASGSAPNDPRSGPGSAGESAPDWPLDRLREGPRSASALSSAVHMLGKRGAPCSPSSSGPPQRRNNDETLILYSLEL